MTSSQVEFSGLVLGFCSAGLSYMGYGEGAPRGRGPHQESDRQAIEGLVAPALGQGGAEQGQGRGQEEVANRGHDQGGRSARCRPAETL